MRVLVRFLAFALLIGLLIPGCHHRDSATRERREDTLVFRRMGKQSGVELEPQIAMEFRRIVEQQPCIDPEREKLLDLPYGFLILGGVCYNLNRGYVWTERGGRREWFDEVFSDAVLLLLDGVSPKEAFRRAFAADVAVPQQSAGGKERKQAEDERRGYQPRE
jgi:hypothetical protein